MMRFDAERSAKIPGPRVWPAIVLLISLLVLHWLPALFAEQTMATRMTLFLGPQAIVLLILVWWLFMSRIPLRERLLGMGGIALILAGTMALSDASLTEGFGIIGSVVPWGMAAFAIGFIASHWLPDWRRTGVALLVALVGFGVWTLVRSEGVWGDFSSEYHWRWEKPPEERILAELSRRDRAEVAPDMTIDSLTEAEWPGFRGPGRDGVLPGITLAEDWSANPPRELWRIPVGPGWSSFAVAGQRLFTQEQRGDDEVVVCYDAATGTEIWASAYPSRFWESQGGVGPRATPTLSQGRLFTLGAQGLLHRMNPVTGEIVWKADLRADADREPPTWGFSSSPLVVKDLVIVHAGGEGDGGVLAYDADRGELRWGAPAGGHSYSSPQLLTVAGTPAIAMVTDAGMSLIDPADGSVLWQYEQESQYRILQPLLLRGSSLLLNSRFDGTSRLDLVREGGKLTGRERWASRSMKSDFSDYVAHDGYLYGFDISIFACVDLETGERRWKGGRYGHGQVLLLPDAGQLLVVAENGDLVLVRANPKEHDEIARMKVLNGKTWNHPVLVGGRLYLRNSEEAVGLELPVLP
jgi:outer membrane protein assembly factor BamB